MNYSLLKYKITFALLLLSLFAFSQNTDTILEQDTNAQIYDSTIQDEQGVPMEGINVRVRGTSFYTKTDMNGDFKIKAKSGDVLVLSKDGKTINTIRLTNSDFYTVEDESISDDVVEKNKSQAPRKTGFSKIKVQSYEHLLDSASYYVKKDSDKSIAFIEQALSTSEGGNNKALLSQSYHTLGNVYANLKQYDLAISSYKTSLENSENNDVQIKLAQSYFFNKNYQKSKNEFNNLLKEKLSNWQQVKVYEGLGDVYNATNDLNTAIENYRKGLAVANKHSITPKISDLNTKIGNSFNTQGNIVDAEIHYGNSIDVSKKENIQKRAQVQNSIADSYQQNKDFDKEIKFRKETLSELEDAEIEEIMEEPQSNEVISVQKLNFAIGNAYNNKGSFNEAIDYLEKSKIEAKKVADVETEKVAVQQLSELYNKIGNSNKALESYKEYAKLVDALYKKKESEIQDAITLNKALTLKQGRINSLEKDRALNTSKYQLFKSQKSLTEESNKRQQLIIYSLLGGLLLLLFTLYAMYKSNKQSKLANNLLALKSLRSQMNPHFIFNALNSVNSFIAQNDERSANRYLTEFSTLMRSVLDNSEEDFIPLSKEIELLQLYIKLEHSRFQDKFDYNIVIDENLQTSEFQIPPMLLQPYVENAVWHGLRYKKTKGNLNIYMNQIDAETVEIVISDDGIGRKQSKSLKTDNQLKQKSKGMNNIKKRVGILNKMYQDKVDVFIEDLYTDETGTKVKLTLKKD